MNLRDRIVEKRRMRIQKEGHALGVQLPKERRAGVLPFGLPPGVICEVKRKSPSKGDISVRLDPVKQVSFYALQGVKSVSVLTEEDHFSGSLEDLIRIKQAYPEISVLRKDFLIDVEDINVSYRAGGDAVLLIASILDARTLQEMYARATELGMAALVELHDEADIEKVRPISPPLVGINSRNLETFAVDPLHPIVLKSKIDWQAKLVYESGIRSEEDARLASSSGFDCVLVGEAVVRNPMLVREIIIGMERSGAGFWVDLFSRPSRPLVKICGLTKAADVGAAIDYGADLLGFVFAPSPRRADVNMLRAVGKRSAGEPVRVGVVVSTDTMDPGREAFELFSEGLLDAIQFHGAEKPEACSRAAFPYYKALRMGNTGADDVRRFRCPRVLIDAPAGGSGSTGTQVPPDVVGEAAKIQPLWLAGGLSPENIAGAVRRFSPELVDVSSGIESKPGVKDRARMKLFIENARKTT